MAHTRTKRIFAGSATALGIMLAVSSVAFACTAFRGEITIRGNGTGSSDKSVVGDPGSSGNLTFQWCATTPDVPLSTASETDKASYWPTRVDDSLTVGVRTTQSCKHSLTENKLPAGNYSVGISSGYWGEDDVTDEDNCHSLEGNTANLGQRIDNATFSVGNDGKGGETYSGTTLTNALDDGAGWYTVCVYLHNLQPFAPANAANFKAV